MSSEPQQMIRHISKKAVALDTPQATSRERGSAGNRSPQAAIIRPKVSTEGSSLSPSASFHTRPLAPWSEQRAHDPLAAGSSPAGPGSFSFRPHRLVVRTRGFHLRSRGSIPREGALFAQCLANGGLAEDFDKTARMVVFRRNDREAKSSNRLGRLVMADEGGANVTKTVGCPAGPGLRSEGPGESSSAWSSSR